MIDRVRPRFRLGQVVATPGALRVLELAGCQPQQFLDRHVHGDWGELTEADRQCNEDALQDGSRILSAYVLGDDQKIWIITEAADEQGNRPSTTMLLPDEY